MFVFIFCIFAPFPTTGELEQDGIFHRVENYMICFCLKAKFKETKMKLHVNTSRLGEFNELQRLKKQQMTLRSFEIVTMTCLLSKSSRHLTEQSVRDMSCQGGKICMEKENSFSQN